MFEKVLLAVDGSEHSKSACKHAIALVEQFAGAIDLVYVVEKGKTKDGVYYASNKAVLDKQQREKLDPIVDILEASEAIYGKYILHGDPATEIISFANERLVDCIIIGSRGLNPIQKLFLGSVSTKVVERAACPVFIIK